MKFVTRLIVCVIAVSQVFFKVSLHSYSSREFRPQIQEGRSSRIG